MALSKRLRFEVMRRDNHTCRYCGQSAPDVKLTVDHVTPTALGGRDEPGNLVTACSDCNSGKSATPPDAPLVDDVAQDAVRWAQAIKVAANGMLKDQNARRKTHKAFDAAWSAWTPDTGPLPRPAGWQDSVDSFLAAGLPLPVLLKCIDKAMSNKKIGADHVFRYMCGIAWARVGEIQDAARAHLATSQPAQPDAPDAAVAPYDGALFFATTVLRLLAKDEQESFLTLVRGIPEEERFFLDDVCEAALLATSSLMGARFDLENAAHRLLSDFPDGVGLDAAQSAFAEARAAAPGGMDSSNIMANALLKLSARISAQSRSEAVTG